MGKGNDIQGGRQKANHRVPHQDGVGWYTFRDYPIHRRYKTN